METAMPAARWDEETLDDMRQRGDGPADRAIAAIFSNGDLETVQRLMETLFRNDEIPTDELPPAVRSYLAEIPDVPAPDAATIVAGEQVFADYGPEILMLLACYALPASYAAGKGVQVLFQTSYLHHRPTRRLFETTQMVLDVMTPGGLAPHGRGRRTAQKVRLMHAAIRSLILNHPQRSWPQAQLGIPINQEDLAGTLMTFSTVVLDGLARLRIRLPREQAEAYLSAWCAVGRMMGIVEELIPRDLEEARTLTATIQRRQISPSPEGQLMTSALLEMLEKHSTPMFKRFPAAIMRHLLPPDVADGLGIPRHRFTTQVVDIAIQLGHELDHLAGGGRRRKVFRAFGLNVIQVLIAAELGGRRASFRVPSTLSQGWSAQY
jgi:uncharacterized protein (DUF2236 family)